MSSLLKSLTNLTPTSTLPSEKFREIVTWAPVGIYQADWDGKLLTVNRCLVEILGYDSEAELLSCNLGQHIYCHESDRAMLLSRFSESSDRPKAEVLWKKKNGSLIWVELTVHAVRDDNNGIRYFDGFVSDITQRKQAEQEVRFLAEALRHTRDCVSITDPENRIMFVNESFCKTYGYDYRELIGKDISVVRSPNTPQDVIEQVLPATLRGGWQGELLNRRKDGSEFPISLSSAVIPGADGRPLALVGVANDITERRRADAALRESEERYRQLADAIQEVFWLSNAERTQFVYVSPAFEKVWGYKVNDLYTNAALWLRSVHPDDRPQLQDPATEFAEDREHSAEYRIVRSDCAIRWIRERAFPVRDASGQLTRIAGIAEDITDQKELEAKFLQAQKMESIGRLAGGVAHDFNNLMTAIGSFARLSLDSIPQENPARGDIEQVIAAADRAVSVTRQLLAFARQQPYQPVVVDPNKILVMLKKMLTRLIREDIELIVDPFPEVAAIKVDPGLVEQALINLVVNARDAMPMGGKLTIRTSNRVVREDEVGDTKPGRYVMISVCDTGVGMAPEVQAHLFEPFFTTKEVGRGTGLGLAMVYGIVTQSGGQIEVKSEVGRGTMINILFPQVSEQIESSVAAHHSASNLAGTETIMVAEDEPEVRKLITKLLKSQGYTVLEAPNGEEALHLANLLTDVKIDLLVTDMVMPKISGRELGLALRKARPKLRILFISGYTTEYFGRQTDLAPGDMLLPKPFGPTNLLEKVREALDSIRDRP